MERKKKNCIKCGKENFIFSKGRCKGCANIDYAKKAVENKRKKHAVGGTSKDELSKWYDFQISVSPKCCEECNTDLAPHRLINPRIPIAHIIPKSNYPSVSTHILNVLHLCTDCHTNYDNKGAEYRSNLKVSVKAKKRGLKLFNELTPLERLRFEKEFGYILK